MIISKQIHGFLIVALVVLCPLVGCNGKGGSPLATNSETVGTREWPLSQGSRLTAAVRITEVDEFSSETDLEVTHALSSPDQQIIEKLEMQFEDANQARWTEVANTETQETDSGSVQTFRMGFSAPTPWKIRLLATFADGSTEELIGWEVDPDA